MRNIIYPLLAFVVLIICGSCTSRQDRTPGNSKIFTVGVNLPLTGNAAHWGNEMADGLKFGFQESDSILDNGHVELRIEDNVMNPREAVSIAMKFADIEKADIMITGYTPVVKSTIGIAEQKQMINLATLTSAVEVADGKEWVFRDFFPESVYMPILADYASDKEGLKTGSFLVVNDDYGRDARRFFELSFTSKGGTLSGGEFFESSDLDLRNKVEKALSNDPQFILIAGRGSAMINACRQIREMDNDIRIYAASGINDPKIWEGLGTAGNGVVFARIDYDEQAPAFMELNKAFQDNFGYEMTWVNVYGYTIAQYLTRGFVLAGNDKEKMRSYLMNLNFSSIRGQLVMNENHDVLTPLRLFIRENDTIEAIQ